MFIRGFKSRCANLSTQFRLELGLHKYDPLLPHALAEHLGVQLLEPTDIAGLSQSALRQLRKDRDAWSAVTVSSGGHDVVIYNSSHIKGRQSSDIMHELSHLILGHKPIEMMLFSEETDIVLREYDHAPEEEASWLAGCLLLPREALFYIRSNNMDERQTCEIYCVSRRLLVYRMDITGINRQFIASR